MRGTQGNAQSTRHNCPVGADALCALPQSLLTQKFYKKEWNVQGDINCQEDVRKSHIENCVSSAYPLCHYARELIEKGIDFSKVCIPVKFVKRGLKGFTFEPINL